jgi:hypothetical protein
MNLEYLLLPLGVACLVVPTSVICGGRMRERLNQPVRRHNEGLASLIRSPLNWMDLARGAAGAWLLQDGFKGTLASGDELAMTFLAIQFVVLFAGVLAQTLLFHKPVRVIGPLFFLTGITLVISGWLTGGFALVIGYACALMVRRLSIVFVLVPPALIAFGVLFHEISVATAFNAAVFALPTFLCFRYGTRISFVRSPVMHGMKPKKLKPAKEDATSAAAPEAPVETVPETMTEAMPEVAPVIRPDFERIVPPVPAKIPFADSPIFIPRPKQARRAAGEPAPLPDFLRLADEPEPAARKTRRRIFARKEA